MNDRHRDINRSLPATFGFNRCLVPATSLFKHTANVSGILRWGRRTGDQHQQQHTGKNAFNWFHFSYLFTQLTINCFSPIIHLSLNYHSTISQPSADFSAGTMPANSVFFETIICVNRNFFAYQRTPKGYFTLFGSYL